MSSYSWSFAYEGLAFEIVYSGGEYQLVITEGTMDLNALWFSNGDSTTDGDTSLEKGEKSLNMNGEGSYLETEDGTEKVTWDSYSVYSDTGLRGEEPLGAGTYDITSLFSGITEEELLSLIVGVRATSVNGEDSVKLTSESTLLSTPVVIDFETGSGLNYEVFEGGYQEDGFILQTAPTNPSDFEGIFKVVNYSQEYPSFGLVSEGSEYAGAINRFADSFFSIRRDNYNPRVTGDEFDFVGGNFADGFLRAGTVEFTGFNNGVEVFNQTFDMPEGFAGYLEVNATSIDFLTVADGSSSTSIVFDNLDMNLL